MNHLNKAAKSTRALLVAVLSCLDAKAQRKKPIVKNRRCTILLIARINSARQVPALISRRALICGRAGDTSLATGRCDDDGVTGLQTFAALALHDGAALAVTHLQQNFQ
jgi:hypothetical protein